MKVIQIVGYKNSGKTTLATKMIKHFTEKGLRVGSLKHHGHGGEPVGITDTDSEKHRKAGAIISGVQGERIFQISSQEDWKIEKMLAMYQLFDMDVVILEGYKTKDYKKIVMITNKEDLPLLNHVKNTQVIVTSLPTEMFASIPIPVYQREESEKCIQWVYANIMKKGSGEG